MDSTTCVKGFRSQRHIDAFASHGVHYLSDNLHNARLATGITMQYSLHVVNPVQRHDTAKQHPTSEPEDNKNATTSSNQDEDEEDNVERLVMIMGFVQAKEAWSVMLDFLLAKGLDNKKRLEVLTFDNRGVGGSDSPWGKYSTSKMAEDTFALMDHVGWKRAHVAGISMGGMISMEMASLKPERICSLVLIVTSRGYYFPEIKNLPSLLRIFTCTTIEAVIPEALKILHVPSFLSSKMEDRDETLEDVLVRIHIESLRSDQACAPTVAGWIGQCLGIFSHHVSDQRLHEIRDRGFPILMIGGQHDKIIPPKDMDELYSVLKADHVRHVIYHDAGHGCFVQYCEEVMDEIRHHIFHCESTRSSLPTIAQPIKQTTNQVVEEPQQNQEQEQGQHDVLEGTIHPAVDHEPAAQPWPPKSSKDVACAKPKLPIDELREQLTSDAAALISTSVCA